MSIVEDIIRLKEEKNAVILAHYYVDEEVKDIADYIGDSFYLSKVATKTDMELESGAIDCIWNGFTVDGREDDYTWSQPYVDNSQVIVVAEDSGISSLADLAGKNVGVQAASAALTLLQEDQAALSATFGGLQEFADYNSAFVELQAGSVDAIAMDVGVANYQIKSRGEGYTILSEVLNSEKYAVGFKKGNTELCKIVDADLTKLAEDGTIAELAEKYDIADLICIGK